MSFWFTIREGFKGFSRARLSTTLTIISIFFSHYMIALFLMASFNFERWVEDFRGRVELEVFLEPGTTDNEAQQLRRQMMRFSEVEKSRYISKKEAAARFEKEFGRNIFDVLQSNPLPTSIVLNLKPPYRRAAALEKLTKKLETLSFVDEVVYPRRVIALLDRYMKVVYLAGAMLLLLLLLITFVLIYNTIRLTIFARRDIIEIMQLVGARRNFIKRPFIIEGLLQGFIGASLSMAGAWGSLHLAQKYIWASLDFKAPYLLLVLLSGLLIGYISAGLSVAKHLKEI